MSEVVWSCMHIRHTRYDDWEITCNDCGEDLTGRPEFVDFYVPDSFMEKWYPEWYYAVDFGYEQDPTSEHKTSKRASTAHPQKVKGKDNG